MTARKPPVPAAKPVAAVEDAQKRATIPTRPVIQHTALLRAELQAALNKATSALLKADNELSVAADDRDTDIALATKRFDAIRLQIDAERNDLHRAITGIEAALQATGEQPSNVVVMAAE